MVALLGHRLWEGPQGAQPHRRIVEKFQDNRTQIGIASPHERVECRLAAFDIGLGIEDLFAQLRKRPLIAERHRERLAHA